MAQPHSTFTQKDTMEIKTEDIGLVGGIIGVLGVLVGWVGRMLKTTWSLSKFESRVVALEVTVKELEVEEITSRVTLLEGIAAKLENVPELLSTINRSVIAMDKIIFQERGGLNVMTLPDHDRAQAQCQSLFRKDLDHIKGLMEQVIKQSGAVELSRIEQALGRLEAVMSARVRMDNDQHQGGH